MPPWGAKGGRESAPPPSSQTPLSSKTGTAQVSDTSDQTNAWFVGYAKKDGYKDIAIAVVVENSGAGSTYAVPVAKNVFDVYFNR